MKIAHSFEIKIALLGNVSAGKTTVMNALFRDKYGEVSMKRTTAGVNYFRISSKSKLGERSESEESWSVVADDPRGAASTHNEIVADNKILRESNQVKEKMFDIELEEDLVEMRKDTKLVIIDIPGLNEAGSSHKYKDYVVEKWDTFDCVIVVMDGRQGVNTDEQVDLLKFVKSNHDDKKKVPLIVLFNKVDDPDDEEQAELVDEARAKLECVFGASNLEESLARVVEASAKKNSKNVPSSPYPVFIPISAVNAFIHQSASLMTFEQFKKFDKDLIERLGRDQIGKKLWRNMSDDTKYKEAFKVITDPTQYQEGMKEANFDKFLTVLANCCGGTEAQHDMILSQLEMALKSITFQTCISTQLRSVYDKIKAMQDKEDAVGAVNTGSLTKTFWQVYKDCEDAAFDKFDRPNNVEALAEPMQQLVAYHNLIRQTGWEEEQDVIITRMKSLVRHQMSVLFEQETVSTCTEWKLTDLNGNSPTWKELSPHDWAGIFSSMTLLAHDKHFCEAFGREQIVMEELVHTAYNARLLGSLPFCAICNEKLQSNQCETCNITFYDDTASVSHYCGYGGCSRTVTGPGWKCNYCSQKFEKLPDVRAKLKCKYNDGHFEPEHPDWYKLAVHLEVPGSFSDPKHFGHVAWKYCQLMASVEATK